MYALIKNFLTGKTEAEEREEARRLRGLKSQSIGNDEDLSPISSPKLRRIKTSDVTSNRPQMRPVAMEKHVKPEIIKIIKPAEDDEPTVFTDYIVEEGDSVFSIAFKFNVSPYILKTDNSIYGDNLFPGQTMKIRMPSTKPSSHPLGQPERVPKMKTTPATPPKKEEIKESPRKNGPGSRENLEVKKGRTLDLTDLKVMHNDIYDKYDVLYYTNFGEIKGTIRISSYLVTFDPIKFHELAPNPKKEQYLSKFKLSIDITDISDIGVITLPSTCCGEDSTGMDDELGEDFLLQFSLIGLGTNTLGRYVDSLFSEMRKNNKPFATVYLRMGENSSDGKPISLSEKKSQMNDIIQKVKEIKEKLKDEKKHSSSSVIPYYDILYENFSKSDSTLMKKLTRRQHQIFCNFMKAQKSAEMEGVTKTPDKKKGDYIVPKEKPAFKPTLSDTSLVLNYEQFSELLMCVPEMYRGYEWIPVYVNMNHGTSMSQLMRRAKVHAPLLIMIKDENGFCFGAYCNESLRDKSTGSHSYYGSGECFLWTFRDTQDVVSYTWSKKNDYFILTAEDGLNFGGGNHYGLWINQDIQRGRTEHSDTFDNDPLAFGTDFEIIKIEIWSIKDPFADM
jgi:LysM repeat protein